MCLEKTRYDTMRIRHFAGVYQNIRITSASILLFIFYVLPWTNIRDNPTIFFDLAHRKFYIFGSVYFPQDFTLLSLSLIMSAIGLFTITVLVGRIWCGYACPQSMFTWVFLWIERLIEGNSRYRTPKKQKKSFPSYKTFIKHILWLIISAYTAITFISFFIPIQTLLFQIFKFSAESSIHFWLIFFTLATYLNAGWLREKVCLHMCPYARFQSVMFDPQTLVVTYDKNRGEPRGSSKTKTAGDCIDCKMCVQSCPTGIDIRNGLQYECINCGACIDACNTVMKKLNRPLQLIKYGTEELATTHKHKNLLLRPKLLGYFFILLCTTGLFLHSTCNRQLITASIAKDNYSLFSLSDDHKITNLYVLHITNKYNHDVTANIVIKNNNLFTLESNSSLIIEKHATFRTVLKVTSNLPWNKDSIQPLQFNLQPIKPNIPAILLKSNFFFPKASLQNTP